MKKNECHPQDAIEALQAFVDQHETQAAAAANLGISGSYLHDLLNGKRTFSDRILHALGLRRIIIQDEAHHV